MTLQIRYSNQILNYLEHFPFASINMEPQHKMVVNVSIPFSDFSSYVPNNPNSYHSLCVVRQHKKELHLLICLVIATGTLEESSSFGYLIPNSCCYVRSISGYAVTLSCHQCILNVASQSSQWITCLLSKKYKVSPDDEPLLGDAARFVIMPPLQFELASMPSESGITNVMCEMLSCLSC
ncbi:hypothetical protein T09_519 [Trichinella sp. T9]|nr:hypothetical protein T09_519 [Trichinella sp. T9]